ncbi:44019_t:CDS:2, partial [Gigaspora margarita]
KPSTNIIEPEPTPDMSIQVEQTIEYETVQNPVKKKTQNTTSLQGEYKQRKENLIANNRKEEYDYALISDTEIDNMRMNLNNTEKQIQATMECPNEKVHQATIKVQISEVLNTKDKLVAQYDNSGESTTPIYMRGNKDLRDELNTLSFTNNLVAQSNEYAEPHINSK